MSDTEPIDVSFSLSDPWQQQERELARIANEVLIANKTALFDALAAARVTRVIVNFDGCGDSDQIEMIEARTGDDECALPDVEIETASTRWGSATIDRQSTPVRETIETLVYDVLSQNHCGWEDNDGACGEFTFDVTERTITLDYNERHMGKAMPRIVETIVFHLDELSEPARETARAWYREAAAGDHWHECIFDDFEAICAILGVRMATRSVRLFGGGTRQKPFIWFRGFSSQGDGACFEGSYAYAKDAPKAIRAHAPEDR